jgi:16S rRNA processing protein RimM
LKTNEKTDLVAIGKVSAPSGLRGEFRINLYATDSLNLKEGKYLLFRHVGSRGDDTCDEFSALCKSVRYQKDRPVIRVEGIEDRNAAEELRGMEVCIEADELDELAEGEHYVRDLIGCRVVDLAAGEEVGVLKDVIQNTAQSVLEVETSEGKLVLIPAVDAFLRRIDEEARLIEVELIPGFLE